MSTARPGGAVMPLFTICQSCGVRVRIPRSVVRSGRAAQCPKCRAVLTGPALTHLPAGPLHRQPSAPPEPGAVVPVAPGLTPSVEDTAEGDGPSDTEPRGGINCAGLVLATGAVLLVVLTVVVGAVMVGGRMGQGQPTAGGGPAVAPAEGTRREQLLRRLEEVRATRKALEKKRDDLERAQEEDLDAVLAVNKELHRLDEEERQLSAELQGRAGEKEEPGP